jgi:hypothetical protein
LAPPPRWGAVEPRATKRTTIKPAAIARIPGLRSRHPAIPTAALIAAATALAIAATGTGLWLALGHHGGGETLATSRSATSSSAGAAINPAPSPYRFAASGELERACSVAIRSSGSHRAASVDFADRTGATTVRVYWVSSQGVKRLLLTLRPGASGQISGDLGDAWQLKGPGGCLSDFTTTAVAGRVTVENAKT